MNGWKSSWKGERQNKISNSFKQSETSNQQTDRPTDGEKGWQIDEKVLRIRHGLREEKG